MELSQILGWIATFLFTICYIPQIIKTYKTKTKEKVLKVCELIFSPTYFSRG